ncbi:cob(I)yrinic acid a,c-diamide adenosyltransferase [Candidatus Saccharibacteria bacterium]|nr:cob(I)yrinic acid a,c-diamide adenosyltransferase [Candidatus Saccharibacteria bacterium]MCB9821438.1 cob(I)yrinic acid a,c-diamide adenosyltransferase [Candidatus Nomurabacteria bacterium]
MSFEDFQTKQSVVVVYTGEGKGKTSASLGLVARALGRDWRVAYVQFIKHWRVGEHDFLEKITPVFKDKLVFKTGGKGFYNAGDMSAKNVSVAEHKQAARDTYEFALEAACSGKFDLVVCDEINNAVHDGLLEEIDLQNLIEKRGKAVSLCLTGRNFPEKLLSKVDIATNMTKLKHHFDDKFLANKGIDY